MSRIARASISRRSILLLLVAAVLLPATGAPAPDEPARMNVTLLSAGTGGPRAPRNVKLAVQPSPAVRAAIEPVRARSFQVYILPGDVEGALGEEHRAGAVLAWDPPTDDAVVYLDARDLPPRRADGEHRILVRCVDGGLVLAQGRAGRALPRTAAKTDVVLLLDSSTSMKKSDWKYRRLDAAATFLRLAADGGHVDRAGAISFTTRAAVLADLTPVTNPDDILPALKRVGHDGQTSLDRALAAGLRMLQDGGASHGAVVLLTDGRSRPAPYANEHERLVRAGVPVYSVGLGDEADHELLARISRDTGGESFRAASDNDLVSVYQRIASALARDVLLLRHEIAPGSDRYTFPVDATVQRLRAAIDTTGTGFGLRIADEVTGAEAPSRTEARSAAGRLGLNGPRPGEYAVDFRDQAARKTRRLTVTADSALFLDIFPPRPEGAFVHLAATLANGAEPVRGATVRVLATARLPGVLLYDDGAHDDGAPRDGVYGGSFRLPPGVDREHRFRARAEGALQEAGRFIREAEVAFRAPVIGRTTGASAHERLIWRGRTDLGSVRPGGSVSRKSTLHIVAPAPRAVVFRRGHLRAPGTTGSAVTVRVSPNSSGPLQPGRETVQFSITVPAGTPAGSYKGTIQASTARANARLPIRLRVVADPGIPPRPGLAHVDVPTPSSPPSKTLRHADLPGPGRVRQARGTRRPRQRTVSREDAPAPPATAAVVRPLSPRHGKRAISQPTSEEDTAQTAHIEARDTAAAVWEDLRPWLFALVLGALLAVALAFVLTRLLVRNRMARFVALSTLVHAGLALLIIWYALSGPPPEHEVESPRLVARLVSARRALGFELSEEEESLLREVRKLAETDRRLKAEAPATPKRLERPEASIAIAELGTHNSSPRPTRRKAPPVKAAEKRRGGPSRRQPRSPDAPAAAPQEIGEAPHRGAKKEIPLRPRPGSADRFDSSGSRPARRAMAAVSPRKGPAPERPEATKGRVASRPVFSSSRDHATAHPTRRTIDLRRVEEEPVSRLPALPADDRPLREADAAQDPAAYTAAARFDTTAFRSIPIGPIVRSDVRTNPAPRPDAPEGAAIRRPQPAPARLETSEEGHRPASPTVALGRASPAAERPAAPSLTANGTVGRAAAVDPLGALPGRERFESSIGPVPAAPESAHALPKRPVPSDRTPRAPIHHLPATTPGEAAAGPPRRSPANGPARQAPDLRSAGAGQLTVGEVRFASDWDSSPLAAANLVDAFRRRTGGLRLEKRVVDLDDDDLDQCQVLFMTGNDPFALSEAELAGLRSYLDGGGALWVNDSSREGDGRFDMAFRREIRRVVESPLKELPQDHPIMKSVYDLAGGFLGYRIPPGDKYRVDHLEGVVRGGRLAVLYTRNDYADGMALNPDLAVLRPSTTDLSAEEMLEGSLRMGMNAIAHLAGVEDAGPRTPAAVDLHRADAHRYRGDPQRLTPLESRLPPPARSAPWSVEAWGNPATVRMIESGDESAGAPVVRIAMEPGESHKVAVKRDIPADEGERLDLRDHDAAVLDIDNGHTGGLRFALLVSTIDPAGEWHHYESRSVYLRPGMNAGIRVPLTGERFKSEATGWKGYDAAIRHRGHVGKLTLLFYNADRIRAEVEVRALRLTTPKDGGAE